MNFFVQYHNVENEGLLLSDPPFTATRLAIHTRRPNIRDAEVRVFLIAGVGRPRRFFLWETFEVEEVVASGDGEFKASGSGWQLAPPVELSGKPFEDFKSACANFVGFRSITDLPFGPPSLKLLSFRSGRTSYRDASMLSTTQPTAKASTISFRDTRRGP